jgi:copper transport protein
MKRFFYIVLSILLLAAVSPLSAHGYIVRAIPEDGAVLGRSPARLQYWFSEGLEVEFSAVHVRDASGREIASGGVDPDNTTMMRVQLPPDLPEGAYVVELRPAFASDGHVFAETRVFFVGAETASVAGKTMTTGAIPLEVFWRAVLYASTMLLFGAFVLYSVVLVPAWGSASYPAGLLPPRLMQRLNWIVGISLVAAVASNLLALLQQSMALFNTGLTEVLSQGLWSIVRAESRFGDVWNFRMVVLLLAAAMFAASLYFRREQPQSVRAFWTANTWVMALAAGTFSVVSHAAGSVMLPWIGIAVDWLHTVGVGFWVGGLMALVLVLPVALKPYTGDTRRQALLVVLRRYSRLATGASLIVITSGIYSALMWIYTPDELTGTNFGLSLMLKVGLVVGLLALGAFHHLAAHPQRFEKARLSRPEVLSLTLWLEVLFAFFVLAAAALLTATPVPVPSFAENQVPPPRASQIVNGYTVTQTITPGGPGTNTYDISVTTSEGQAVEGLEITLQQVFPALDLRPDAQTMDSAGGGLYVSADGAIDRPGEWWTVVDIRLSDGTFNRAAFRWEISADASVIQTQPPGIQHLIALLTIMVVLMWVTYPTLVRLLRRLDLNPTSVFIAAGATAAASLLLAFGFVLLQETSRQYQARITPPPAVVNTVLPDAASLEDGQRLYHQYCAAWESQPEQLQLLRARLSDARDAEVFEITRKGWRDLPPCEGDLRETERWSLVNYLRFLQH